MTLTDYIQTHWRSMSALAEHLDVSLSSLSMWASGARRIPMHRCLELEEKSGGLLRREILRPDLNWKRTPKPPSP